MARFACAARWLTIAAGLGACSSSSKNQGIEASCAAGQTASCVCPDGQPPGPSGCVSGVAGSTSVEVAGSGAFAAGGAGQSSGLQTAKAGAGSGALAGAAGTSMNFGASGAAAGAGTAGMTLAGAGGNASAGHGAAGAAGSAGAGMAGMLAAGAGGDAGASAVTDCGQGGTVGKASTEVSAGRGYGSVEFSFSDGNQIERLQTTLEVPVKPNGSSTLFLWPGLEPLQGTGLQPIGTGVLQPVLTWGGSCAPGSPRSSMSWWISAQYVNTLGTDPGFMGCYGGKTMTVGIGDQLLIDMSLNNTSWTQTVSDQMSGTSVDFSMDLMGQPQRWALFEIEMPTSTKPAADVVFTNTVITLAKPEAKSCQPSSRGANDYFSAPVASSDGLRCCIARLVLRAQGVPATTMP